jgi:hypothetical protein
MKIYFGFTVAGDRSSVETARRLVKYLEELGHDVPIQGHKRRY